jgi:GMP synthase (glutamine-hydrolysing)
MSIVWVIQHAACESLGIILDCLQAVDLLPHYVRVYEGHSVPRAMGAAKGLIVLGGPMSVYEQDRYKFLRDEQRLIGDALEEKKPVLGICLGSQLLAATLGVRVTKGTKEIGWYPVTLTESAARDALWSDAKQTFTAYHWHGDVFDVPDGATLLARSERTPCQAFRYGSNAYGVLFHMETTMAIINEMVRVFRTDLASEGIAPNDIVGTAHRYLPELQKIGKGVYSRWAGLIVNTLAEENS